MQHADLSYYAAGKPAFTSLWRRNISIKHLVHNPFGVGSACLTLCGHLLVTDKWIDAGQMTRGGAL